MLNKQLHDRLKKIEDHLGIRSHRERLGPSDRRSRRGHDWRRYVPPIALK
jgi:hypothetical protein